MGSPSIMSMYLLYLFNIVCAIMGLITIIAGATKFSVIVLASLLEDLYSPVVLTPAFVVGAGVILVATALFGWCSTVRESSCMLSTYAVMLIMVWIFEICWISYIFSELGDDSALKNDLYEALRKLFHNNAEGSKDAVEYIQTNLQCCGLWGPNSERPHSSSCCSSYIDGSCVPFQQGCWPEFYNLISDNLNSIATVIGILAIIQMAGAGIAMHVANSNKKNHSYA